MVLAIALLGLPAKSFSSQPNIRTQEIAAKSWEEANNWSLLRSAQTVLESINSSSPNFKDARDVTELFEKSLIGGNEGAIKDAREGLEWELARAGMSFALQQAELQITEMGLEYAGLVEKIRSVKEQLSSPLARSLVFDRAGLSNRVGEVLAAAKIALSIDGIIEAYLKEAEFRDRTFEKKLQDVKGEILFLGHVEGGLEHFHKVMAKGPAIWKVKGKTLIFESIPIVDLGWQISHGTFRWSTVAWDIAMIVPVLRLAGEGARVSAIVARALRISEEMVEVVKTLDRLAWASRTGRRLMAYESIISLIRDPVLLVLFGKGLKHSLHVDWKDLTVDDILPIAANGTFLAITILTVKNRYAFFNRLMQKKFVGFTVLPDGTIDLGPKYFRTEKPNPFQKPPPQAPAQPIPVEQPIILQATGTDGPIVVRKGSVPSPTSSGRFSVIPGGLNERASIDKHDSDEKSLATPRVASSNVSKETARPVWKTARDERLINEAVIYILEHDGPDSKGTIHPVRDHFSIEMVLETLRRAQAQGLSAEWRPYHFARTRGVWTDPTFVNEVLVKKLDQLLLDKFDGNMDRLISEVRYEDIWATPLMDTINNRTISVSLLGMGNGFVGEGCVLRALQLFLEKKGLGAEYADLRPYHSFNAPEGTWNNQQFVNEVIVKKVNELLKTKYDGNLSRLISNVSARELFSEPFEDHVGSHVFTVSLGTLSGRPEFRGGRFPIIQRYLQATNQTAKYEGLRPYHLSRANWTDSRDIDDVIVKKVNQLLSRYGGDLHRLIANTTQVEFFEEPLLDNIGGTIFEVSLQGLAKYLPHGPSPYDAIQRYLQIVGRSDEFAALRSYHMRQASPGTFDKPGVLDGLIVKKVNQLLESKYEGDLNRLISETNQDELFSPLYEMVAGQPMEVSMGVLMVRIKGRPFLFLKRFLELTGRSNEASELRPYHLAKASKGTWRDEKLLDEAIVKKITQLLNQKYGGDIHQLIANTNAIELFTEPLIDTLGGQSIEVTLGGIRQISMPKYSCFTMISRYLRAVGREEEFKGFRPYHMSRASANTWDDAELVDEILVKKIDHLLREKYHGKLDELVENTTFDELFTEPLIEIIGGKPLEVKLSGVGNTALGGSTFKAVKRYCRIKGIPFRYTRQCFTQLPETRRRRIEGGFNAYDLRLVKNSDGTHDTSRYGMRRFASDEKVVARDLMADQISQALPDKSIHYLGLETEHFEFIRLLSQRLTVDAPNSAIVEIDQRTYNAMKSVQRSAVGPNRFLQKIKIVRADINEALASLTGPYNVINLDYLGHLSAGKAKGIEALFKNNGLLEDSAVVIVTLSNRPIDQARADQAGFGRDQVAALEKVMKEKAGARWTVKAAGTLAYAGGTNGRTGTPMVLEVFKVDRIVRTK